MRLNEILTEQQINEISWKDVAKGAGIAVGAAGKGVGSGIKSFASGVKTGYKQGFKPAAGDAFRRGRSTDTQPTKTNSVADKNTRPTTSADYGTSNYPSGVTYNQPKPDTVSPDAATDRITMKTIKTSIQQLPKNQRDQLRQIVAARAKVA